MNAGGSAERNFCGGPESEFGAGWKESIMDLASLLGIIAGVAVTVIGIGWFLLREISSQLRALRQGFEEKMDSKIQQLEDGQIALGRQIARLEGLFDGLRRPFPEKPRAA